MRLPWRTAPDDAFVRAVYAEHGAALLGHVLGLTGDRGRAEDIVQETVVRAWRHADRLEADQRPLRPWLFTVASRLAIDEHRARGARPREVSGELVDVVTNMTPASNAEAPESVLETTIDRGLVLEALKTLSPAHREAIVETYYRGRSVAEAAEVLGVPAGTVKSRVYYGLRALRLALEERGWTP